MRELSGETLEATTESTKAYLFGGKLFKNEGEFLFSKK